MLSYRHAFHAGNHADVMKHLVLLALLQQLRSKDKPFACLDTHSGNGFYEMGGAEARKTGEAGQGIMRLWPLAESLSFQNTLLRDYFALLRHYNPGGLQTYPGSPAIMQSQLRDHDRLTLMELHTTEIELLRQNFRRDERISIHHRDGFEGAVALSPPSPRRGLMLIDPAYEDKSDYQRAVKTVQAVHQRWSTGIIALWYPLLGRSRDQSDWLKQKLRAIDDQVVIELSVSPQSEEFGMHGSGMLIVNPPWQFAERVEAALAIVKPQLSSLDSDRMSQ
jgi:23S rRNA (adenine2030-N6)-methyltransferase